MDRFKHILYLLDQDADRTPESLRRAVALADNNQAELTLLMVLPPLSSSAYAKKFPNEKAEFEKQVLAKEQAKLKAMLSALNPGVEAGVTVSTGKPYIEATREVQTKRFDMVIKEAEPTGWLDRFLTSEDMHLLRNCPCPVWLMKPGERPDYHTIVAAVDFDSDGELTNNDELNQLILDLSSSLSLAESASLHLVNAYDVPEAGFLGLWMDQPGNIEKELFETEYRYRRDRMKRVLETLKGKLGEETYNHLAPQFHLVQGPPGFEIPKLIKSLKADLVVIGTVARTGISGVVIGNTAENILSGVNCSVLAVKPKSFVSPIS